MKRQRDVSVRDGTGPRSQEDYRGKGGNGGEEGEEDSGRTKWRMRKQEQKKAEEEEEGWLPRDAPRHNGEN